jgi:hypothetical protein
MEAVWGVVLAFLFVLATLSGNGPRLPSTDQSEKDKSEQSDKSSSKDESDKSDKKDKSDQKDKSGQQDKGSSAKASKKKAEFCIRNCPGDWRIRP